MSTIARPMTADELFMMKDDGFRYELVKGELRQMSPAGSEHGAIIMNLAVPLAQYVRANNLGVVFGAETGFKIATSPDTVRAPDIAFVRRERIPQTGIPKEFWPGAPDLAVEVLSPDDRARKVNEKIDDWLASGVSAVWVVNPKRRSVTVHRSQKETQTLLEDDELDGQDVVSGFRCRIIDVFV